MDSVSFKPVFWRDIALPFLLLLIVFALLRHPLMIAQGIVAVDDFAANELLILDAKSFNLLHGNYSRVGFYHPGPFFFQLMAASEALFFDKRHWVASPIAAHVLAALTLYAASITALYSSLFSLYGKRGWAALGALLTVVVAGLIIDTRQFYNGQLFFLNSWPPFLYMGATLVLLAGLCSLATRRPSGVPLCALGLMMLIHGHASFIGLAPLTVLSVFLFFGVSSAAGARAVRTRAWMRAQAWPLALALLIVAAFCWPILLNTLCHWPGELPKYFAFAGGRKIPSLFEIAEFWWGFGTWFLLVIPACLTAAWGAPTTPSQRIILLVLVAVVPEALFYSVLGLDTLEYKYPLFWIGPAFGLMAALAAIDLTQRLTRRTDRHATLAFLLLFSVFGFSLYKRQGVFESGAGEEFRAAVASIHKMAPPGQYVWLEPDTRQILPIVYTSTLAALDKRGGRQTFCVTEKSWNIAYTEAYRCDPARHPRSRTLRLVQDTALPPDQFVFRIGPTAGRVP